MAVREGDSWPVDTSRSVRDSWIGCFRFPVISRRRVLRRRARGSLPMSTPVLPARDRAGRVYKPAIGSRLRPLLWVILIGFALLAANGFYLSSVTALTWYLGTTQQTFFYMLMVALHLFLGLVLVIPFLIFGCAHLATSWTRPNKWAIRYGLILLGAGLVTLVSGFILV